MRTAASVSCFFLVVAFNFPAQLVRRRFYSTLSDFLVNAVVAVVVSLSPPYGRITATIVMILP